MSMSTLTVMKLNCDDILLIHSLISFAFFPLWPAKLVFYEMHFVGNEYYDNTTDSLNI